MALSMKVPVDKILFEEINLQSRIKKKTETLGQFSWFIPRCKLHLNNQKAMHDFLFLRRKKLITWMKW